MQITTTESIPGQTITEICGVARGSTVRARNVGRDITAFFKTVVGGELSEYTSLQADAREQALERLKADAARLNADAVVNVRFETAMIATGAAEILVYGTAVRIKDA